MREIITDSTFTQIDWEDYVQAQKYEVFVKEKVSSSKEEALTSLLDYVHPGAIYLIHPSNRGNYEALEEFIIKTQKQGYRFALLDDLVSS